MVLKKLISRILSMCELSWYITIRALMLSCVLAFCAFVVLSYAGEFSLQSRELYHLAEKMSELPCAVILILSICALVIEDVNT